MKFLKFLVLLLITSQSFGQYYTPNKAWQIFDNAGFKNLFIANDTTTVPDVSKNYIAIKNAIIYYWNGTKWAAITGTGTGGTSYTLPQATPTTLGGIKYNTDFYIDANGRLGIDTLKKAFWNTVANLPLFYAKGDSVWRAIHDTAINHDLAFTNKFTRSGNLIDLVEVPFTEKDSIALSLPSADLTIDDVTAIRGINDTSIHPQTVDVRNWIANIKRDTINLAKTQFYRGTTKDSIVYLNIRSINGNKLYGDTGNIVIAGGSNTDTTNLHKQDSINAAAIATNATAIANKLNKSDTTGKWLSASTHIPLDQVNSDWNATSGVAQILNKPTIPDISGKTDSVTINTGPVVDTLVNYYGNLAIPTGTISKHEDGLVSGGVVTSGSGLSVDATGATYYINGKLYTSAAGSIALNAADPALDRQDVIAVNTSGQLVKKTGTAAVNPIEPQTDPATELPLTSVYISAGATSINGISTNVIYNENAGGEWATAATGVTSDASNTVAPFSGTKAWSLGAWSSGDLATLTNGTTFDKTTLTTFKFYLRLKATVATTASINIKFFNGNTAVSNELSIVNYGLNKSTVGSYQNISIPISAFSFTSNTFNKVQIRFGGTNASGVYIDYVQFQNGIATTTNANFVSSNFARNDSLFYVANNKQIFFYKAPSLTGTYFPLAGGSITGTGGNGYVGFKSQSTRPPTPPAGEIREFMDSLNQRAYINSAGRVRSFNYRSNPNDAVYYYQNKGSGYTVADSADVAAKLNISDTANMRLRAIAGTNVTITGTYPNLTFNSTASGGGSTPTLQQVTTSGNVTTDQIVSPTHRFTYAYLNGSVDSIVSYGDSYTVGLNSTGNALGYAKLLSTSYNLPFLNLGFSSSGSFYAAKTAYAHTQPLHNNLETVMAGLNDVRRGSSARATLNKIIWGHNAIIANHFMKSYVAAGASSVSRVGTWTTGFNVTTGGGKTTNGATTTTINDNISYSFTDSTVIIGLQGADGTAFAYADFTIYIDNVVYASKTENVQTDGLADVNDPNTLSAMAVIIRGLTNTSHTVKLVNNSSGKTLAVDYFGHLLDASFGKPILVFDIPYLPTGSYSLGSPYNSGSIAATDIANGKVDSLLTGFSGYPVYKVKTNNFYTNTTASGDVSGDLIHPTDQGHQHIRNAALAVYNYSAPNTVEGTQRFDFTQHKISWFDGSAWQTPSNSSATFNDANVLHKTGDETISSGTKTITSAISAPGGASTPVFPFKIAPALTAALTGDTLAGIYINPTFLGAATPHKWGIYSTRDFSVNGVRMGIGNSTDQTNVVMGRNALDAVTTGTSNSFTAVGYQALKASTNSSFQNTGIGAFAGQTITSGTGNTAVGTNAMYSTSVGVGSNVAVGLTALGQITGSNNVGIGSSAGRNASSNGIFIGAGAGQSETASGTVVIHNGTTGGLIAGNATNGQLIINAQKNHLTPSTTVLSGAAFEVYNNYNTANRGSIASPIVLQAQRDAIAVQNGVITRIYVTSQSFTGAPTVAISGSGTGATATATFSAGAVYITVTNGGTGYTPNSTTVTLSGGGGTGTAYALVGAQGLSVFCADCTATDGSTGVLQYYNGAAWKNAW